MHKKHEIKRIIIFTDCVKAGGRQIFILNFCGLKQCSPFECGCFLSRSSKYLIVLRSHTISKFSLWQSISNNCLFRKEEEICLRLIVCLLYVLQNNANTYLHTMFDMLWQLLFKGVYSAGWYTNFILSFPVNLLRIQSFSALQIYCLKKRCSRRCFFHSLLQSIHTTFAASFPFPNLR